MKSRFEVIKGLPKSPNSIFVTIPAYKELSIVRTLQSIVAADRSGLDIRVRVLINASETDEEHVHQLNNTSYSSVLSFIEEYNTSSWMEVDKILFTPKQAGVGLARKTLMDSAASFYQEQELNGIIAALDADCTIAENYFQVLSQYFSNSDFQAASIFFEHPLVGDHQDIPIMEYEWHLRSFINLQQWAGFPFAIHTVGSSMCCFAEAYLVRGGMNKRKAGEDFYFLHKFIKDQVCGNILLTTVFPSGRISDRVPFGTGRAIGRYVDEQYSATTYNAEVFRILKIWNSQILLYYGDERLHEIHPVLQGYLESIHFEDKMRELRGNVSSTETFQKRFYQVFDAFHLMKCLHHMRSDFPDVSIQQSIRDYNDNIESVSINDILDLRSALCTLRHLDRSGRSLH